MHQVTLKTKEKEYVFQVRNGANLLMEAASRSLPLSFRCTTGKCGTCKVYVTEGIQETSELSEMEWYRLMEKELEKGGRLACQTFVYGDIVVEIEEG